jgi:hypothetical protein
LPRHPEVLALAWDNACGCGRWFLSGRAAPAPAARVVRGTAVRFLSRGRRRNFRRDPLKENQNHRDDIVTIQNARSYFWGTRCRISALSQKGLECSCCRKFLAGRRVKSLRPVLLNQHTQKVKAGKEEGYGFNTVGHC